MEPNTADSTLAEDASAGGIHVFIGAVAGTHPSSIGCRSPERIETIDESAGGYYALVHVF
jgi:hypothetical protein